MTSESSAAATMALRIADSCRPFIAGHDPAIQGAAVAELFGILLAGMPDEVWDDLITLHVDTAKASALAERKIRGVKGHA